MEKVRAQYEAHHQKTTSTFNFTYKAHSWRKARLVVARLEYGPLGPNPRFVISSRDDDGFKLYYDSIVPGVTWKTGSRISNWICSPTAPPVPGGGPTSGG